MTFGERLKYFRKKVRKSQKSIEKEIGIPQATLSGWENDNSEPTVSDVIKLARTFCIKPYELLEDPVDNNAKDSKLAG